MSKVESHELRTRQQCQTPGQGSGEGVIREQPVSREAAKQRQQSTPPQQRVEQVPSGTAPPSEQQRRTEEDASSISSLEASFEVIDSPQPNSEVYL